MKAHHRLIWTTFGLSLAVAACSSSSENPDAQTIADSGSKDTGTKPDLGQQTIDMGSPDAGQTIDMGTPDSGQTIDMGIVPDAGPADTGGGLMNHNAEDCDPLMPAVCTFPWPSNLYLKEDSSRTTGYSLTFGPTSLPVNSTKERINHRIYQQLDGFGPGEAILTLFPNLDASRMPDENHIPDSLSENAAILLYEVGARNSLTRVPYFAELDSGEMDAAKKVLFVRPATILKENTRYIIAFRNLRNTSGTAIMPSAAFDTLRAGQGSSDPALAPRQARFTEVFSALSGQGVDNNSLVLAWDFVTASSDALHGKLLHMRDDAFTHSGNMGPPLSIDSTTTFIPTDDGSGRPVHAHIGVEMEATLRVPNYLRNKTIAFVSHTVLNKNAQGMPERNGTRDVKIWIRIPHSALTSTAPVGLMMFGHGLLGSGDQVRSGHLGQVGNEYRKIYFAADLEGFSEAETIAVGTAVTELSAFEFMVDTQHQGLLNYLLLVRSMRERFASLPEVRALNINVDSSDLHYSGISQGGIFGASFMALSQDITRGHLGVPGQNYSTLLHRSVDFVPFFEILRQNYPSTVDQAIGLGLVQLIWNMTDPVSYYGHIKASPFANTPSHDILAAPARGDYQVSVLTMEIVARTNGLQVPLLQNYDVMRQPAAITPVNYPHRGSGIVLYSYGNPWPPAGNVIPMDSLGDPHGQPRRTPEHNRQMMHFLRTGEIIDVCGGEACRFMRR